MYEDKPLLHKRQYAYESKMMRTMTIDVTPKCNMECKHCYATPVMRNAPVGLSVMKRTLDELYEMGVYHIVLLGGEPIMDKERLEFIVRNCHPDETYVTVTSNGWNVSREDVRWLKEIKVDKVIYSIDSGIPEEHDANRQPESYERAMRSIRLTMDEGMPTGIGTLVKHSTVHGDGLKRLVDLALENDFRLDVQIIEPVGKWDGQVEDLITPEDAAHIKNLQRTLGNASTGQTVINRDVYSGETDHCPAGTEFMALTADGRLLPCNFLQFSLGNVKFKSIKEMRASLLESPWFDGEHSNCLCGENHEFINRFIIPYVDRRKPLDAYEIFGIEEPPDRFSGDATNDEM